MMKLSNELAEKIERYFHFDEKLKNRLLRGDADAIRDVGMVAQSKIGAEDVVEAYENDCVEYLYQKAKTKLALEELYHELVNWYVTFF